MIWSSGLKTDHAFLSKQAALFNDSLVIADAAGELQHATGVRSIGEAVPTREQSVLSMHDQSRLSPGADFDSFDSAADTVARRVADTESRRRLVTLRRSLRCMWLVGTLDIGGSLPQAFLGGFIAAGRLSRWSARIGRHWPSAPVSRPVRRHHHTALRAPPTGLSESSTAACDTPLLRRPHRLATAHKPPLDT